MQNVSFKDSQIIEIDFSKFNTTLLFSINLSICFVQYCNFSSLEMNKTSFKESKLFKCQFADIHLQGACFERTDLKETQFQGCDLRGANFGKRFKLSDSSR
jgi:fluoroquinolone resistance protein